MANSVQLVWDLLPDNPDSACRHGMPEGCKIYWRNLAKVAIETYTNVSIDLSKESVATDT